MDLRGSTRIIGGKYRSLVFLVPGGIRPTQSIARKSLFDMLGQDMEGVSFLDLFSGSGAIGLEAISRGAKSVVFVEKDSNCVKAIGSNTALFPLERDSAGAPLWELHQMDAFAAVKQFFRQGRKFDIVFVDPPYGRGLGKKALKTLEAYDILQPNCLVVIEHEYDEILPRKQGRFLLFRQRKFGATCLTIYQGQEGDAG